MSRSVTFNGITRFRPGGIIKINAEALNQIGLSANSVVGLIGESSGGEPGSSSGLISLRDPSRATDLFRDGPLVDAIRLAFQSSGDPSVPGGASEVVVYKVNASTQSSIQIPNPAAVHTADVADAGATTLVVPFDSATFIADALIGRWVDIAINSLPILTNIVASGGTTRTATAAGLVADTYIGATLQFAAATTTAALQDEYATIIANDGATLTFDRVLPAAVAATDAFDVLTTYRRRIVDNSTSGITLAQALPAAPAVGDSLTVRPTLFTATSKDYGAHTESVSIDLIYSALTSTYQVQVDLEGDTQVSSSLGGRNYLQLYYKGGANAVATDTIGSAATTTATSLTLTTGGLVVSAHVGATLVLTNPATGSSEQTRILTNAAGALTLEGPGLSSDFVTEIQAAGDGNVLVDIKTVTNATATVTGAAGIATTFATAITGVTLDNLSLTIAQSETVQQLVDRINQNSSYVASVPNGVNANVALAQAFDFGADTEVNIQKQSSLNGDLGFRQDLAEVIAWLSTSSLDATAVRSTTSASDGSLLPRSAVSVDTLFASPFGLVGGARGASSNLSWQEGFDILLTRPMDNVVPLIDRDLVGEGFGSTAAWASVSQQLVDHVSQARGAVGLERGAFIGFRGTKAQIIAAANSINDQDIQLTCQSPTVLNAFGTLVQQGPRELAVMGASMRSGVEEIGEPLTHKYLRTSALAQDSSWAPGDVTDSADFIINGVFFAEQVPGRGIRWVRDMTTWVKSDNLAYTEGSVRSVVRYVAYNLRTILEDRFTGRKAAPATINAVKDTVVSLLELYRASNIIVDSTDPATGSRVKAYHNLKVFSDGDVLRVNVGIFPVPGINFQLTELFLQLPTQSA